MATAEMSLNPEIGAFQDFLERLSYPLTGLAGRYAVSCPIDDPATAHVVAETFYTPTLRRLTDCGFPYFIRPDCERGVCAVVYVR